MEPMAGTGDSHNLMVAGRDGGEGEGFTRLPVADWDDGVMDDGSHN